MVRRLPRSTQPRALLGSAHCELSEGQIEAARGSIEHARTLAADSEPNDALMATLLMAEARLQWADGLHPRAAASAAAASAHWEQLGAAYAHQRARVDSWRTVYKVRSPL